MLVRGPNPGQIVEIVDALGRQVSLWRMPSSGLLSLELAVLPAGLYVVRAGGNVQRLVLER